LRERTFEDAKGEETIRSDYFAANPGATEENFERLNSNYLTAMPSAKWTNLRKGELGIDVR